MAINLSAVILAKNEEKNIERCIKSVQFCSEIIVIDDNSTDSTVNIAQRYNAKIIPHKITDSFSNQRNYAFHFATGEWVLFIDADEEVSKELQNEIIEVLTDPPKDKKKITAYYLKRRDYWWSRELKYGEITSARNRGFIRLMKKKSGKWMGFVHEVFVPNNYTSHLQHYLNHYPHQTVAEFLSDINRYSSMRARELYSEGVHTNIFQIILYPLLKFKWNYFIKLGFLDGAAGFAYAFFMSFHSFLVRAKLYQYRNLD